MPMLQPADRTVGTSRPEQPPADSRARFRDAVMLVYLVSSAIFLLAGILGLLEELGVVPAEEGWAYTIMVFLVFGIAFAAIPAVIGALVVVARLWRDPAAWIPSALWLVTVVVAAFELSRPAQPGAAPGEPPAGAEYVILGCLVLYTVAAGYSGLRWLAQRRRR